MLVGVEARDRRQDIRLAIDVAMVCTFPPFVFATSNRGLCSETCETSSVGATIQTYRPCPGTSLAAAPRPSAQCSLFG